MTTRLKATVHVPADASSLGADIVALENGALQIQAVQSGSPASQAMPGIRSGDTLLQINSVSLRQKSAEHAAQSIARICARAKGADVTLHLERGAGDTVPGRKQARKDVEHAPPFTVAQAAKIALLAAELQQLSSAPRLLQERRHALALAGAARRLRGVGPRGRQQ